VTETSVADTLPSNLIDAAVNGIIVMDGRPHILAANRACERLFGYDAGALIGCNPAVIIRLDERPHVEPERDLDLGHLVGNERQACGLHRDGTQFPVEISVGEAGTSDGPRFIAIVRDLRRRREVEQRRARLQASIMRMVRILAMDEMASALSHEVNQPLTALMLYLQAVVRVAETTTGGTSVAKVTAILDKAVGEAERVGQVIQRMRQFVERPEPERRPVNLNPLVSDAVDFALVGIDASARVVRRFADDLPPVLADALQIQQVVINLTRNAVESSGIRDASRVSIATQRAASQVLVVVEGPAIPPQKLPELFEPFSASIVEGLGLAISRTIAQNHGGGLQVEPGGGGSGARYTLRLPLSLPPDGAPAAAGSTAQTEGQHV
jgi:two-component system, LuxR family, sensor kinase FixL